MTNTPNPSRFRVKGVQACYLGGVGFFQGVPVTRVILAPQTDNIHPTMTAHQVAEKCRLVCGRLVSRPSWLLIAGHTDNHADNELRNVLRVEMDMRIACEMSGRTTVVDTTSGSEPRFVHWDHAVVAPPKLYDPRELRAEIFQSIVFPFRTERDIPVLQSWSVALDANEYEGDRYIHAIGPPDIAMRVVSENAKRWRFTRAINS